jgi:hypothetical protein
LAVSLFFDACRTLNVTRIASAANKNPGTLARGLDRTLIDHAAIAFFFPRQSSRPSAPRPVAAHMRVEFVRRIDPRITG